MLLASEAMGCPVCDSETGLVVRAGIFNDQFFVRALATLAPFPVLLAVVARVHYGRRLLDRARRRV